MEVLSHYTSPVIEFVATQPVERQHALVDNCTGMDPMPPSTDASTETQARQEVSTQTESCATGTADYDVRALAKWLQHICPMVEQELLQGMTPTLEEHIGQANQRSLQEEVQVQTYQKIAMGSTEHSQGLATWLSVHTNNAPILVVTIVAPHDDWCEHIQQQLHLYVPKRMPHGNFVVYTEAKKLPLKSCLRSMTTNPHNKNIFAGASMDGDIYVWLYEQALGGVEIKQLHSVSSTKGAAVALDWVMEQRLLVCYANGAVQQWLVSNQMLMEWEYTLPATTGSELTAMLSLGLDDFVVGTNDGSVYRCWHNGRGATKVGGASGPIKQLQVLSLRRHRFMVSTLLKTNMNGHRFVLSCDLSGQAFYHDMRNMDEDAAQLIVQIPLPFKNAIACSRDGNIIYCPSNDGALEYYRVTDGAHAYVKGALRGRGSLIKASDNGCWLITGLYGDEFQIFYIEN
ncbi:uncharacterized protein LOC115622762 [Scaptodrosophila lebanonensis]|uniref:Uncharacterized protein LOC115622762 n=1 Tax=Drosophila lebanonensis TaxID=7225 RepID=A0A6J2TCH6_DROLE|nr:uncharacterized protein LOC115622762 [Scaptodrosophila lebanonensis]